MSTKHSPLPWKRNCFQVNDANDKPVLHTGFGVCESCEEGEANAELIERAVNSHTELLEALKAVIVRYTRLVNSGDCGNWDAEAEPQVIQARAAIAKAEGCA